MERQLNTITKVILIGFGFINGLCFSIGTSPRDEILKFINEYFSIMEQTLQKITLAIPIILMTLIIITIIRIYRNGGILGSAAVLLAFTSGAIIRSNWKTALIILSAATVLGLAVFRNRQKNI